MLENFQSKWTRNHFKSKEKESSSSHWQKIELIVLSSVNSTHVLIYKPLSLSLSHKHVRHATAPKGDSKTLNAKMWDNAGSMLY